MERTDHGVIFDIFELMDTIFFTSIMSFICLAPNPMENLKVGDISTVGLESDLGANTDTRTTENVDM